MKNIYSIIIMMTLFSLIIFLSSINVGLVGTHVEEKEAGDGDSHSIVLSKYKDENIDLIANPEDKQWRELSSGIDIQSIFGHKISVNTYLFFLLSWNDSTKSYNINPLKGFNDTINYTKNDGAKIIFEPNKETVQTISTVTTDNQNIENNGTAVNDNKKNHNSTGDVWYWNALEGTNLRTDKGNLITKAEWKNNEWHVILGKRILNDKQSRTDENITTKFYLSKPGILQKDLLTFAVWDGAKGESFDKALPLNHTRVNKLLQHDFILLSNLNIHPKDVYMWSGILTFGIIIFVLLEIRLHKISLKWKRKEEGALP
jgi:hypothetical protein